MRLSLQLWLLSHVFLPSSDSWISLCHIIVVSLVIYLICSMCPQNLTPLYCRFVFRSLNNKCKSPLPSAGQHPSYGDCLEVKGEYYQNCSVLDCVTQCSRSAAHLYEQFLQVQLIGFVTLGPLRSGAAP